MAEIIQSDGTWTFDGDAVRIVPGRDKGVHAARQSLGELTVPLEALAGIAYEPGRKSGRLRLRLREGADPLRLATGGRLPDGADPYQLSVDPDRSGVAEYFVDEVRNALLLDEVPTGPCDRFLLPGPAVPLSAAAGDGIASFDGDRIRLEWNWKTEESKKSAGPRTFSVADLDAVEWRPAEGLENGYLRFRLAKSTATTLTTTVPKHDPHAIELYGFRKDPLMALVAAAVVARMPHPAAPADEIGGPVAPQVPPSTTKASGEGDADHDALLRRLRELGELRQSGVLTEEEFTAAKQSVLRRF
ncbi:DUF4429 domain-containing protein [Streptomyces sp. XD-27]|uniref:DUF4429 domain-containing protein n=1 Tax=Streptomyces sp. XD-27 TaxID=3062779 RepID=UPI0026F42A1F|nr:DUF4429 domain-containing protein [Streptomyces sp. XD-27]WKX70447.1 DUF4429 domain-containing protein [Streptomyces sp. XD-27]